MVKDLNVFPFDNDMKKAHFGTKLCIYHEKTVSVYQRNTIFTVYFKKSGTVIYGRWVDIFFPQHAGFDLSSTLTYTRMKLKKSGIPKKKSR
jgi:hypothetical protein